jgi:hypothetical protein
MLEAIDTYGREIKPGDIVMSYGEFLIYSHQTEKRLMCKRPGNIFSPFTWVQKTNYNLVKFVPELADEFMDRMRAAEVEYEDYQREKLMPGRDW